jgi:signal transduction histidine kinase
VTQPFRYRVSHVDGSWRWLESLTVDLRDVPPISGYLVLSRDVTESEEQRQALEAATARLAQLDRSRNQVLSAVSHELRTPLSAIMSASEHLATDHVDEDELHAYAQLIHRNASRLEAMVADLLLIGRMQSGSLPVDLAPVDVPALVEQAVAANRRPDGPAVTVRTTPGPPARADARRLSQVVENLLTNALKFGGPSDVDVSAVRRVDGWVVTVSDRGPGIEADELEHVVEPFYRGRTTASSTAGSGVGLSIAKGIVELHGGTLELRPRAGGGTDAVVTVPDRGGEAGHVR